MFCIPSLAAQSLESSACCFSKWQRVARHCFMLTAVSLFFLPAVSNAQNCKLPEKTPSVYTEDGRQLIASLALLANVVYKTKGERQEQQQQRIQIDYSYGGWMYESEFPLEPTGFYASIFTNSHKDTAIVFRGTDMARGKIETIKDFVMGNAQNVFGASVQHLIASKLAKSATSEVCKDCRIIFVGHSLGGGLAQIASLTTGYPAVTFNSAPWCTS